MKRSLIATFLMKPTQLGPILKAAQYFTTPHLREALSNKFLDKIHYITGFLISRPLFYVQKLLIKILEKDSRNFIIVSKLEGILSINGFLI